LGRSWHVKLGPHLPREVELNGVITLVQGLPTGNKMDWIVEKAVELGVHTLVPIAAARSVTQLNSERRRKRLAHWQRIAISASEQCGRNRIMHISDLMPLDHWLAEAANHWCALCHPESNMPLAQALQSLGNRQAVSLLVGPEGGWTPAEQHAAQTHGAITVKLGPRILRTETAGLALVAAATALLGWT
jgi:16S rRNA (uracil1498-N3)-methyltransferase